MSSLEKILLDINDFTTIPQSFLLGLTNLQTFSISENINLSPWKIPLYLTESTNLVNFYASNASITGEIPDIFDSFLNLQNLRLSYNNLTGSLSGYLGNSDIQNLWLNNQNQVLLGKIDVLSSTTKLSQVTIGNTNIFCKDTPGPCDPKVTALLDVAGANGYSMSLADAWKRNDACNGWRFITCDS
ncbi:Leucine-rich repeat protein kinase family protein [Forsythia ovata]|uniref:Leucine-rich repeat protein kinase family protein n=1 Tax=Forsythia ovata TaxID=205694 RepID=A0ABD1T4R3_9LAMI